MSEEINSFLLPQGKVNCDTLITMAASLASILCWWR